MTDPTSPRAPEPVGARDLEERIGRLEEQLAENARMIDEIVRRLQLGASS